MDDHQSDMGGGHGSGTALVHCPAGMGVEKPARAVGKIPGQSSGAGRDF